MKNLVLLVLLTSVMLYSEQTQWETSDINAEDIKLLHYVIVDEGVERDFYSFNSDVDKILQEENITLGEQDFYSIRYEDDTYYIKIFRHKEKLVTALAARKPVHVRKILTMDVSAYTYTGNYTYTGVYPKVGTIAVDPKVIPLGTTLWVEGYGYGVAQDIGKAIKGNRIDVFMNSKRECLIWGRRKAKVVVFP